MVPALLMPVDLLPPLESVSGVPGLDLEYSVQCDSMD